MRKIYVCVCMQISREIELEIFFYYIFTLVSIRDGMMMDGCNGGSIAMMVANGRCGEAMMRNGCMMMSQSRCSNAMMMGGQNGCSCSVAMMTVRRMDGRSNVTMMTDGCMVMVTNGRCNVSTMTSIGGCEKKIDLVMQRHGKNKSQELKFRAEKKII